MPEYLPPVNLSPIANAYSQAAEMRAQRPSPWAALLQGVAPYAQLYGKGLIQNKLDLSQAQKLKQANAVTIGGADNKTDVLGPTTGQWDFKFQGGDQLPPVWSKAGDW